MGDTQRSQTVSINNQGIAMQTVHDSKDVLVCRTAKLCANRGVAWLVEDPVKGSEPRNRMREIFKSGSVGGAPGNRCFYPEPDGNSAMLHCRQPGRVGKMPFTISGIHTGSCRHFAHCFGGGLSMTLCLKAYKHPAQSRKSQTNPSFHNLAIHRTQGGGEIL